MTTSHSQNTWTIVSGYFSQKQQLGESFLFILNKKIIKSNRVMKKFEIKCLKMSINGTFIMLIGFKKVKEKCWPMPTGLSLGPISSRAYMTRWSSLGSLTSLNNYFSNYDPTPMDNSRHDLLKIKQWLILNATGWTKLAFEWFGEDYWIIDKF